ncbi:plasmid partitioning protein RepA [Cypionkella psychrotolerans]|uniref:plasmid partitioning protein RepA n=1 Tax=Cypionkella psychrotolerans TaxID=1678131 RepID=UPI0006B52710|nr:plasmid partitioning protein RepA [Cypionkella psychrotolerans]
MTGARRIDEIIQQNADRLAVALENHMRTSFMPDARKELRPFTSAESAEFLGMDPARLRKLHFDNKIPEVAMDSRGRRLYSGANIVEIRRVLETQSRKVGQFLPGRRDGDRIQVIAVANYKGGSSKTTTAIHLAQRLALRGYRVLAIDIDPQGSLTTMFGYTPETEFQNGGNIYDAIRYDDPIPMQEVIRKTYFPNLDLAASGLVLAEFEHETPRALNERREPMFFKRLGLAIDQVEADYDVVVIDCPPQLGFLTMSALIAATTVLITVIPSMLDIASMNQFLQMTAGLLNVVSNHGASLEYDHLKFLITRFEPSDGPQAQMAGFLRALFTDQVMTNTFLKSTAVSDAGLTQQTLYEVDRSEFNRNTYDRAVESINSVVGEMEELIQAAWGRN